ncbi:hypothetical protein OXYTRIMIC_170 [Oxytricha trifallax]|uniref:Uncharacterized protein n=1 Tax=Oxytricha trifallax TaxID=1172189 RepID=A0A073HYK2_9SPIT|nr:hypothetical protein OXYTRIMIC_170 [Oxytricha trifallax]
MKGKRVGGVASYPQRQTAFRLDYKELSDRVCYGLQILIRFVPYVRCSIWPLELKQCRVKKKLIVPLQILTSHEIDSPLRLRMKQLVPLNDYESGQQSLQDFNIQLLIQLPPSGLTTMRSLNSLTCTWWSLHSSQTRN